ncbi:hypothetical protein CTA1_12727 [Colletotrichum tanaceti]|uniref:Uncharacterized protein n=1 Tax=Colletotrichum tanaceti TaxID=1306861 RepID=A0A4V6DG45_9PEZI|nr:hypothetical protein CTA1_12727 [Colletotrichum tanaceti]
MGKEKQRENEKKRKKKKENKKKEKTLTADQDHRDAHTLADAHVRLRVHLQQALLHGVGGGRHPLDLLLLLRRRAVPHLRGPRDARAHGQVDDIGQEADAPPHRDARGRGGDQGGEDEPRRRRRRDVREEGGGRGDCAVVNDKK